jgi:DNA (cytosine-5)-methyltransferase 1
VHVLDLFSGIGGFSLGLERAGMRTVAFCEIDPYCRAVLRKHWPDVPIYEDVRKLNASGIAADIVCGGFPCQPFSQASAGLGRGIDDDRYLWPEMCRVISECKPPWVLGENVDEISGLALEQMVSDLEGMGYEVAPPLCIPACAVGFDHRRDRYWFLGHSDRNSKPGRAEHAKVAGMRRGGSEPGSMGAENGIPARLDRLRALGNAVVPQIPEIIGRAIMNVEAQDGTRLVERI